MSGIVEEKEILVFIIEELISLTFGNWECIVQIVCRDQEIRVAWPMEEIIRYFNFVCVVEKNLKKKKLCLYSDICFAF